MITVENNIGLTVDIWNYCHNSKCIGVWLAHTGKNFDSVTGEYKKQCIF